MATWGSVLSSSDVTAPEAVIEYPGGAVVQGLAFNSAAAATANTAAINAAIVAAKRDGTGGSIPNGLGGRVVLPAGDIHINGTILIQDAMGIILEGDGHSSRLIWQGANDIDTPVIYLSHGRQCTVKDFQIIQGAAFSVGVRTARDNHANWFVTPTANRFKNLFIDTPATSGIDIGGGNAMADANNDFNLIEHCTIANHANAAYRIIGSQSYNNMFVNCHAIGGASSAYGVYLNNDGCSMSWFGGSMSGNSDSDFYLGRSDQPMKIEFVNSEGSGRLVHAPFVALLNLTLKNIRWFAGGLHADKRVIYVEGASYLKMLIEHCALGTSENAEVPMILDIAGETAPQYFNFVGNTVGTSIRDGAVLFPGHTPTHGQGNTYYLSEALTW